MHSPLELIASYEPYKSNKPSKIKRALTIGKFDACHLGHQKLIQNILAFEENGLRPTILSFKREKGSASYNNQLFSQDQQMRMFQELGVSALMLQDFSKSFQELSFSDFYEKILSDYLDVQVLSLGKGFCFGKNRLGTLQWLSKKFKDDGKRLNVFEPLKLDSELISSSRVREKLKVSQLSDVSKMLGRDYVLEGKVVQGQQLGRKLGFPTANLSELEQLLPVCGVYAGQGLIWETKAPSLLSQAKEACPVVVNIGYRPSVTEPKKIIVEAHFLDKNFGAHELYGKKISLYLKTYIRRERKFEDLQLLRKQISLDVARAKKLC